MERERPPVSAEIISGGRTAGHNFPFCYRALVERLMRRGASGHSGMMPDGTSSISRATFPRVVMRLEVLS